MLSPQAKEVFERALIRSGIDPVEYARKQVVAAVSDVAMWEMLIRVADPTVLLTRVEGGLSPGKLPFARADILVSDLTNETAVDATVLAAIRGESSDVRVVVWSAFTDERAAAVLNLLLARPIEVLWRDEPGEVRRLGHILQNDASPTATALAGHLLACEIASLSHDVRTAILRVLGGHPVVGKGRGFAAELGSSYRTAERAVKAAGSRSLGRLLRCVRHIIAWDYLQAGGPVPEAARIACYQNVHAYNDAFRELVGTTPHAAQSQLSTDQFVHRAIRLG